MKIELREIVLDILAIVIIVIAAILFTAIFFVATEQPPEGMVLLESVE